MCSRLVVVCLAVLTAVNAASFMANVTLILQHPCMQRGKFTGFELPPAFNRQPDGAAR